MSSIETELRRIGAGGVTDHPSLTGVTKDQHHNAKEVIDADLDSYVTVEKTADKDYKETYLNSILVEQISKAGIVTLPKQSSVRAYLNQAQSIPTGGVSRHILLELENNDVQNECDVTVVTGVADATSANQLKDTGQFTQVAAYYIGRTIWNVTDGTYAAVTGKADNDTLNLDADIMADTESYILYFSRITVIEPGGYLVVGAVTITDLADGDAAYAIIAINGVDYLSIDKIPGNTGYISPLALDVIDLASNDYITLHTWHNKGVNANILNGINRTFLTMVKVS